MGDITLRILGGGTPSKNSPIYWDGDIPWASVKDLSDKKFLDKTFDSITQEGVSNSSTNVIPRDNVIVCTRMGLGKIVINRIDVAINQDLKALFISTFINIDFFYNVYKTINIIGSGMTVKGIKQDELLNLLIPLPPLNEQKRIVEKVDRLLELCGRLGEGLRQAETLREKLFQAVLAQTLPGKSW